MKAVWRTIGATATSMAAWGLYAASPLDDEVEDFVITENLAYAVLTPEAVAPADIRAIDWSPSGQYLLMVQEGPRLLPGQVVDHLLGKGPPAKNLTLLAWSKATRRIRNLGDLKRFYTKEDWEYAQYGFGRGQAGLPFRWIPGTDVAILGEARITTRVGGSVGGRAADGIRTLDLPSGTVGEVRFTRQTSEFESTSFECFPNRPEFVVIQAQTRSDVSAGKATLADARSVIFTVDLKGAATAPVEVGPGIAGFERWLEGGSVVQLRQVRLDAGGKRTIVPRYFDVRQRRFVELANPRPLAARPIPPIEIRATPTETRAGVVSVSGRALWLSSTGPSVEPAVLLSTTAEQAALAPSLDAVALREKGVVTVRPIAAMNRKVFDEIARARAMKIAKMTGLGLLMYGADYDDLLPSSQMFDEGVVDPYLKDLSYKGRFTFVYRGGALTGLAEPAGTPLGYSPGPGGYAVVFADGHTEWRTVPPPPNDPLIESEIAPAERRAEPLLRDKSPPGKKTLKKPEL